MSFNNSTLPPFILKVEGFIKLDGTKSKKIKFNTKTSVVEETRPHNYIGYIKEI